MKGLPLAYSKDMQDDKQPVFEAHDLLMLSLEAMAGMVETVDFDAERMRAAAEAGLFHRHRPRRLAGARGQRAVPRGAPYHRPGGKGRRGARLRTRRAAVRRRCRRSIRRIDNVSSTSSASMPRYAAAPSYGGTAPERVQRADRRGEGSVRALSGAWRPRDSAIPCQTKKEHKRNHRLLPRPLRDRAASAH